MVWRRVQVLRPSWSTSGGQSGGGVRGKAVLLVEGGVEGFVLVELVELVLGECEAFFFVKAEKSA